MQINALGNQLSNLEGSFSEKSVINELELTVTSIYFELLPKDVVQEITKYADFDASKNLLSVSKWISKVISIQNEARKKLVTGIAFGKEEWFKFYDLDIGNEPMLPRDIIEILKSVGDTYALTLIPKGQSLKSLGELAKKYFPTSTGYDEQAHKPLVDILETANEKSYWALMSKDVLNGSRGIDFEAQKKMIAEFSQNANVNCEIPTALEAAVSILTHHVRSKERLFSSNPMTYTRCLEFYIGCHVVVGGFAPSGLHVDISLKIDGEVGVSALRKFRPLVIG